MAHFVRQDKPYFESDFGSWVSHGANGRHIPLWGNPHIFEETGWVSILPPRKFYHQCRHSHLLTEQTNPKASHVSMPPAFACHVSSSALPTPPCLFSGFLQRFHLGIFYFILFSWEVNNNKTKDSNLDMYANFQDLRVKEFYPPVDPSLLITIKQSETFMTLFL